ncbi:MAG: hypothetical protein ACE5FI_04960 [Anaerolineales bacterium]
MAFFMVILRVIHIIGGVFWLGAGMMIVYYVGPTAQALGSDGQKFMAHILQRTKYSLVIGAASGLTLLSGLIMYVIIYNHLLARPNYNLGITGGGLFGMAAFVIATTMIGRPMGKMKALLNEIEAAGGPPKPEQAAELEALGATMNKGGNWAVVTGVIAMVGMASAQYLTF